MRGRVSSLVVDGEAVDGNVIPLARAGATVSVVATIEPGGGPATDESQRAAVGTT